MVPLHLPPGVSLWLNRVKLLRPQTNSSEGKLLFYIIAYQLFIVYNVMPFVMGNMFFYCVVILSKSSEQPLGRWIGPVQTAVLFFFFYFKQAVCIFCAVLGSSKWSSFFWSWEVGRWERRGWKAGARAENFPCPIKLVSFGGGRKSMFIVERMRQICLNVTLVMF